MIGVVTMLKMNLKLLLRNKGYLAFLIILPFLSVIMLNLEAYSIVGGDKATNYIKELEHEDELIMNVVNTKLSVKVYDSSDSKLSDYIIEELAKTGSYLIHRYKGEPLEVEEAREKALKWANTNVIGAVIYIPSSFEAEILSGKDSNIMVFEANQDGRINLLVSNIEAYVHSLYRYAAINGSDLTGLEKLLDTSKQNEMVEEVVSIEVGDTLNLSTEQQGKSMNIGLSLTFLTIGFLFSGVFIAATVVDERNNRVYNRVVVSPSSLGNYGLVKMVLVLLTVLIQTGFIAIAIKLIVKTDFGIPFGTYLLLVLCLGLVFNMFSVVIGVLVNNVLTSNYIAFLVWCLSSLLAGLYFPLDGASGWWSKMSLLMPQRWVVKTSEMLMVGKNNAYGMYLLIIAGYLIVIVSIGLMGIKLRRKE